MGVYKAESDITDVFLDLDHLLNLSLASHLVPCEITGVLPVVKFNTLSINLSLHMLFVFSITHTLEVLASRFGYSSLVDASQTT